MRKNTRHIIRLLAGLGMLTLVAPAAKAQWIGIGLPGPDYYDANAYMNAVPGQWGAYGSGYNTAAGTPMANGAIDQNASFYTNAVDYPNGQYTVTFTAPNPAAINVTAQLDLSNLTNVSISGNTWTGTVTLNHPGSQGASQINISGATASNPVSGFSLYQKGTDPGALTSTYSNLAQNYASLYTLNTNGVVGNKDTITASSLPAAGTSPYNEQYSDGLQGNVVSYYDLVKQANSMPRLQNILVEVPVGADSSALAAIGQALKGLKPGIKPLIAVGGETWNGGQAQYLAVATLAQGNSKVTAAASDQYTQVADETAALDVNAVNQIRAASGNSNVTGYLVSQASNTYFVDCEKKFITSNLGLNLKSVVSYQGCGMYACDNLTGTPANAQGLYNDLIADLPRVTGYVKADVADAHASGLNEIIYEFGLTGELTQSGTTLATLNAFNASSYASQWAAADLGAALGQLSPGDGMEVFSGGNWGPQPDSAAALSNEQVVIDQYLLAQNPLQSNGSTPPSSSPPSSSGPGTSVPEPAGLALMAVAATLLGRRKRRAV